MKHYILNSMFEFSPVDRDSWIGQHDTVIRDFQLFVDSHGDKYDLMAARRVFSRIAVEGCFEVFKPVVELGNVAIISELRDVRRVEFDAFVTHN